VGRIASVSTLACALAFHVLAATSLAAAVLALGLVASRQRG
jgi:hypothetical protein